MRAHLDPVGELEELLVERIVTCAWRLRRLGHVEASVFRYQVFDHEAARARAAADALTESVLDSLALEEIVTDEDGHTAALQAADAAKAARDQETLAIAFTQASVGSDTLAKLSRYEVAIERSLFRSLHELQRLQATRHGREVDAPRVNEMDVSTSAD